MENTAAKYSLGLIRAVINLKYHACMPNSKKVLVNMKKKKTIKKKKIGSEFMIDHHNERIYDWSP